MIIDADDIELWAQKVLCWPDNRKWKQVDRNGRFRSVFGASSAVVADVWNRIEADGEISKCGEPKHLPWALFLLKVYTTSQMKFIVLWLDGRLHQLLGNGLGTLLKELLC
jgi:hypothetical protein